MLELPGRSAYTTDNDSARFVFRLKSLRIGIWIGIGIHHFQGNHIHLLVHRSRSSGSPVPSCMLNRPLRLRLRRWLDEPRPLINDPICPCYLRLPLAVNDSHRWRRSMAATVEVLDSVGHWSGFFLFEILRFRHRNTVQSLSRAVFVFTNKNKRLFILRFLGFCVGSFHHVRYSLRFGICYYKFQDPNT